MSMDQPRNARVGKTGDSRENPLIRGIARHDSYMRKSGGDPAGNRTSFASVGGEQSNQYTNVPFSDWLHEALGTAFVSDYRVVKNVCYWLGCRLWSGEVWVALNIGILRVDESEVGMEYRWNARAGETRDPQGNPPTDGIVWNDSNVRKSRSDSTGNQTRFALLSQEEVLFRAVPSCTSADSDVTERSLGPRIKKKKNLFSFDRGDIHLGSGSEVVSLSYVTSSCMWNFTGLRYWGEIVISTPNSTCVLNVWDKLLAWKNNSWQNLSSLERRRGRVSEKGSDIIGGSGWPCCRATGPKKEEEINARGLGLGLPQPSPAHCVRSLLCLRGGKGLGQDKGVGEKKSLFRKGKRN
ncbi:hypothetical protein PR048_014151 [Dryococelus australis]|uniref:Uncharacterized protein n=1 Tax=Dryococelus australis TaxID=614101 RepID=A0ABQ9HDM1_9NEOP|nr:hypothetical protein PR048_014151 [Dryococelus australis]